MIPLARAEGIVGLRVGVFGNDSELKKRVGEELTLKASALVVCQNVGEATYTDTQQVTKAFHTSTALSLLRKVAAEP